MEAVALFSFTASETDEISFQKGDIIKVEMEDDSCWFTAEIQGKRGYVPENYISLLPHTWFAGRVSRLEAEQRLRWKDTGVFLVRESESAPGEFSVSVSHCNHVSLVLMQRGSQTILICSTKTTKNISAAQTVTGRVCKREWGGSLNGSAM
uniref:Osteoclast-stimulating factor 1 n=1 Tax=Echeneis naucrates TaxID=173247 RepID=A0A665UJV1_ECHNA